MDGLQSDLEQALSEVEMVKASKGTVSNQLYVPSWAYTRNAEMPFSILRACMSIYIHQNLRHALLKKY